MDSVRLAREASRTHGVLLPSVLEREGVTPKERRTRVARGEWRRLSSGILVIAGTPETFEMRAIAALAARPDAALSHQTAGRFLGVELADDEIHLTDSGGSSRCSGARLHRTELLPCDVTRRSGFRVTTMERTLVDLGATLGSNQLRRCIEDQVISGRTTFEPVEATFDRLARPGRPGIARTRAVLAQLDGQPPTESELEAMFERLLDVHGLPQPERQVTFEWSPEEQGRVDGWYPQASLIVELDGRRFHARVAAFERDRKRDQIALMHDLNVVRFTHLQITDQPEWVIRVLRSRLVGRQPRAVRAQ
mgnify:CR=1 FL=1